MIDDWLGEFDHKLATFYVWAVFTHPIVWFFIIMVLNQGRGWGFSDLFFWLALAVFAGMVMVNGRIKQLMRKQANQSPREWTDPEVDIARFSLSQASEMEPSHDPHLVEAAEAMADTIRQSGQEVWSSDGSVVVSEEGCYVAFEAGSAPESAEEIVARY